jgi:hypothetical protein
MIAVAAGNLAILHCAVEHGCPLDWKACMSAAGGGHLSCLQYIVGSSATEGAACGGARWPPALSTLPQRTGRL